VILIFDFSIQVFLPLSTGSNAELEMYNTIADRSFLSPNRQSKRICVSSFPRSLGIVEILGETVAGRGNSHRVVEDVMGHTGCVNTLDWNESGRLASAGDCTK
jgi:hypothetical protein